LIAKVGMAPVTVQDFIENSRFCAIGICDNGQRFVNAQR